MNDSTKIIQLGNKKKHKLKKTMLDEFIPRYTVNDIPEEKVYIDNSFELKQYNKKKQKETQEQKIKEHTHQVQQVQQAQQVQQVQQAQQAQQVQQAQQAKQVQQAQQAQQAQPAQPIDSDILQTNSYTSIGNTSHTRNLQNIIDNYNSRKKKTLILKVFSLILV